MALLSLFFFFFFTVLSSCSFSAAGSSSSSVNVDHIMRRGFSATPNPSSDLQFQSLLTDTTSTFAFGFLRIEPSNLDLAVVHLSSSVPLWRAQPSEPVSWSSSTTSLLFNGSLILLQQHGNSISSAAWTSSTNTIDNIGDKLTLLNSSNLQITKDDDDDHSITTLLIWQSFDFPSDSILQNQNFTSESVLVSANRDYSMKLGRNFLALHVGKNTGPMYWKHTAMEAKATIVDGRGPIYARLDPTGFLGLYQTEKALVDVLSFDSFNAGTPKNLWRLTLESDGNLQAYYYNTTTSGWISDFKAISDTCSLPAACGAYGLCHLEGPTQCGCLENRSTETTGGCLPADSADLCGASGFRVLRRSGVELANEEYIAFQKIGSLEECESSCERNCSCWGALYSNTSGNCYQMDFPIQTVLAVSDERKVGYFKVRDEGGDKRKRARVVLVVIGTLVLVCGCGFTFYRIWNGRKKSRIVGEANGVLGERLPYKGLSSMSSFQNLELSFMKKG